ncbi:universal stress protein [Hanstruepera marina]|uniref:universal stress protein n=1 Tax=Hanstruepera marina TaxID=2873265 RepID=UPI001CA62CA7|nr:universal stress protein [Hanstruepera marina]
MKNNKYKILVLSDLKDATNNVLKNTASLSKMINGEISFFHVKKPTDIIERESQLSAFRTINENHTTVKKRIEHFVGSLKDQGIPVDFSYAFGNVKNEIENYIAKNKPDIIVLGKRNSNPVNLMGDNITDFVLKVHNGFVMIADSENILEADKSLSVGLLNGKEWFKNVSFSENLLKYVKTPIKSFRVVNNNVVTEENKQSDIKTVEYVFERNDNTIQNLSNYLSKSNVNLLLVDSNFKNTNPKEGLKPSDIKSVINQLNIPLLISNNKI